MQVGPALSGIPVANHKSRLGEEEETDAKQNWGFSSHQLSDG